MSLISLILIISGGNMNEIDSNPVCESEISSWFYWNKNGKNMYVIGNKDIDKYFMVDEKKVNIILSAVKLMDGKNTTVDINSQIKEKYQVDLDVDDLVMRLKNAGLLKQQDVKKTNELDLFSKSLLEINFFEIGKRKKQAFSILWNILFVLSIGAILGAVATLILRGSESIEYLRKSLTYKDSYLLGAILAAVASVINIIFHESAHALTSIRCGLQPSSFSMNLYGGFKFLWMVKIKGIYTVERQKRIMIMGAGIYTNFILICISLSLSVWGVLSGTGSEIFSKILINNVFMIMACSMPFNLSDGYFIVSQLTKRMNMRKKMFRLLNFKQTSFCNTDVWDVLYAAISIGMIGYSFYLTGIWCYHIVLEIYQKVNDLTQSCIVSDIVATIPIIVIVGTDLLFIRRFIHLIKANA